MSSQKVTGLASAFEPPKKPTEKSGVTTIASRFDTSAPPQQQQQLQSKISDLASRFSGTDRPIPQPALHIPSTSPKVPVRSPVKESPVNSPAPADPQLSRKVSDLSKAFSEMSKPGKSETFSTAHSAFEKASSNMSTFPKKVDPDGPAAGVAGVARRFESTDKNSRVEPRFETKIEKEKTTTVLEKKVDAFSSVASRFESGIAGQEDQTDQENPDAAKERFRDAAKMFGG